MYKWIFVFFCMLFFASQQVIAQSAFEKYKQFAKLQLDSLKTNGAVVVLLRSKSRSVEAYEKAGNTALAADLMKQINKQNKTLYVSYKMGWNQCPVYFIYNHQLKELQNGVRSGIFVDSTMSTSNTITLTQPYFIILDYGSFYEVQNREYNDKPGKWKSDSYQNYDPNEGTPVKSDCIVVKDRYMKQFRYPFPDYIQTWGTNNGIKKAVATLNNRFKVAFAKGVDINSAF